MAIRHKKSSNKLIDLFKLILAWVIGLKVSEWMLFLALVGLYFDYHKTTSDTNKNITINHAETKAIVSTVSDKSDKTHTKADTIIMYELQIIDLLNKK